MFKKDTELQFKVKQIVGKIYITHIAKFQNAVLRDFITKTDFPWFICKKT